MTNYTALGLSDSGHVELESHYTETECREWIRGYTRHGDFGGYYGIALVSPEGEWVEVLSAPEYA